MAEVVVSPAEARDAALSTATIAGLVESVLSVDVLGLTVEDCQVKEIHPGRSGGLDLQYQLNLSASGGREKIIATVWGTLYDDKRQGEEAYGRLRDLSGANGLSLSTKGLQGFVAYDSNIGLLLRTTIVDDKLPGLSKALDGEEITSRLRAHLSAADEDPGPDGRLEVEVLRYRIPGNRCTFGYRLQAPGEEKGSPRSWRFTGKTYRSAKEAQRDFRLLHTLGDNGFGKDAEDNIWAPIPVAYLADHNMVLMETIPGRPLSRIQSSPDFAAHVDKAGQALAKFHSVACEMPKKHHPESEIAYLSGYAERATKVFPEITRVFAAKFDEISDAARDVASDCPVLAHRDYNFSNLIFENGGIGIIDFDATCNGSAALDIGGFLARLKWAALRWGWSQGDAQDHARIFLDAYGAPTALALADEIRFYYRAFMLRRAYFCVHRPRFHRFHDVLLGEIDVPCL